MPLVYKSSSRSNPKKFVPMRGRSRYPSLTYERKLSKLAEMAVLRNSETKEALLSADRQSIGCFDCNQWNLAVSPQIISLTPNAGSNNGIEILQGTGEANRVGTKITTTRGIFRVLCTMNEQNATTNPGPRPTIVKYWVISAKDGLDFKDQSNVKPIVAGVGGNFFNNNNSSTGTLYDLRDLIYPVNDSRYTVHTTGEMKIGFSDNSGTGSSALSQNFTNNDFKYYDRRVIDVTKYLPKVIRYTDNASQPTTKPVWIIFSCYYADDLTMTAAIAPVKITWHYDYQWKDL